MPSASDTYTNPVYRHACADPFVLKYCSEYWCYYTGIQPDGRCFGILHSTDLVHWEAVGSAMDPLVADASTPGAGYIHYWAPEVTYDNGVFFMYYAAGDEVHMQIRVATATRPGGPFADSRHRLTSEQFAIDAHVFVDDDGSRYLFYATDYLDHPRVGTGTAFDRLLDPFTLAGRPRPVTRALYDWQIYDPVRAEKGGVRWHTLEGPFVLKHDGRYYQMFSGGNWHNASYGVAYGVTDSLAAAGEWVQCCDGETSLPILRSLPAQRVIGPGHNSVAAGPDGRELFCVYHRWQPETHERVLAIDRLGWEGEQLVVYGPMSSPQPVPAQPDVAGFDEFAPLTGAWSVSGASATLTPTSDDGAASLALSASEGVLEVSMRAMDATPSQDPAATYGASLSTSDMPTLLACSLVPAQGRLIVTMADSTQSVLPLPAGFNAQAYHLLRVEAQGLTARVSLDAPGGPHWEGRLAAPPTDLLLWAHGAPAAFAGLSWAGV
jgi:GH43 family beta-xylosidase